MAVNKTGSIPSCIRSIVPIAIKHHGLPLVNRKFILPVEILLGLLGNLLILIVIFRSGKTKVPASKLSLAAMATADALFLLILTPQTFSIYSFAQESAEFMYAFIGGFPVQLMLINGFYTASVWLAVSIATERLIAVRFPLHAIVYLKRRRILPVIACIYVTAMLLNLHFLFSLRVIPLSVCNQSNLTTIALFVARESDEPLSYKYGYFSLGVFVVIVQIIPLVLLITLNAALIYSLRKISTNDVELRRNVNDSSNAQKNERQISMVVCAIVASFVLFNIPSAVMWTIHLANGLPNVMSKEFHIAVEIANILVATGKTINFVVYYCCSEQFRRRVRGFLLTLRRRKKRLGSWIYSQANSFKPDKHEQETVALDNEGPKL